MATASILINASTPPILNLSVGASVALSNANNTGVTAWLWELIDKPAGSVASLSTPTALTSGFTADKEGTYLVRLTVNGGESRNTAVAAIPQILTGVRIPSAYERLEGDALRGWAAALNDTLSLFEDNIRTGGVVIGVSGGAISVGSPLRLSGESTLANGDKVPTFIVSLATSATNLPAMAVALDAAVGSGVKIRARIVGGLTEFSFDTSLATLGAPVYVSNAGALSLTAGTVPAIIGYVETVAVTGRVYIAPVTTSSTGTNTGDVTIGTANGLSLAGQALSLATAIASGANGALLGTDKTKLDNTSGTNTGDVTLGTTNGLSLAGQALSLATAVAGGANGALLGTDKTKLNNTSGTNTGDVTIGTANGLSLAGQAVSLDLAVAGGANGALLGTDKTKLDALSGVNTGDLAFGAFGSTPNAAGVSLVGQVATLQPADGSQPGGVSTTTQTFAGAKTLNNTLTSAVASGSNAYALSDGARLRWGTSYISATATTTTVSNDITVGGGGTFGADVGAPTHTISGSWRISDSTGPLQTSYTADGASAIAHKFDTSAAWSGASAKLLSISNNAVEKAYFDKGGNLSIPQLKLDTTTAVLGGFTLGYASSSAAIWFNGTASPPLAGANFSGEHVSTNVNAPDITGTLSLKIANSNVYASSVAAGNIHTSRMANGSSALGHTFDTSTTYSTAGAKLLSVRNNGSEKLYLDKDGILSVANAILAAAAVKTSDRLQISGSGYLENIALTLQLNGNMTDGASAIAIKLNSATALANATAKIVSIQNNAVEKAYFDKDGFLTAPVINGILRVSSLDLGTLANTIQGGATTNALKLLSNTADGASNVAHVLDTAVALTSTAKLVSIKNNAVEKACFSKDGQLSVSGVASGSDAVMVVKGARIQLNAVDDANNNTISSSGNGFVTFGVGGTEIIAANYQGNVRSGGVASLSVDNFSADGATAKGFKFRIQGGPFANVGSRIATFENPASTIKAAIGKNGQIFWPTGNADSVTGTATLVGGTVTVSTTAVAANSIVMLTRNTPGGTIGDLTAPVASLVAATSFVINSASGTDTSTVNWWIIGVG